MPLTKQQALAMLESDDLIGIGMDAHQLRLLKNDPRVVTYIIDRNINYTNFCTEYCTFCAFYRPIGAKDGYILRSRHIFDKIEETLDMGGTGVLMQGGLHPDLKIDWYENLLRGIKQRFPDSICTAFPRRRFSPSPKSASSPCATPSPGCATPASTPSPAAAPKFSTTKFAARIARLKCTSRRVGTCPSHRSPARHAHHRHHDVRLRRRPSGSA